MKDGNTTGTTQDLKKFHTDEYEKMQVVSNLSYQRR